MSEDNLSASSSSTISLENHVMKPIQKNVKWDQAFVSGTVAIYHLLIIPSSTKQRCFLKE